MASLIRKSKKIRYYFFIIFLLAFSKLHAASTFQYEIHGIEGEALKNVELRLAALQKKHHSFSSPSFISQSREEIKKGLEPYGFFKARITSYRIRKNGVNTLVYDIVAGKQLKITKLTMNVTGSGAQNPAIQTYLHSGVLKVNDNFSVPVYNTFKTTLFDTAKNQGYLRAFFKNHILIDLVKYTTDISILLETGTRFYFGEIIFRNYPYSKRFLQKFVHFKPNEPFSSTRLLKLQQKMERSYYFKRVIFRPAFDKITNNRVPVEVYATPPLAKRYSIGLGYGTFTGARISGAVNLRHIGNEGHHFKTQAKISSIFSDVGAVYYIPGKNPLTDIWQMGVNYKNFNPSAGNSNSITVFGGYSKKHERWQSSFNLNYLIDKFLIYHHRPGHTSHEFYPSWKISYIKADSLVDPMHAFSINLTLQGATDKLFSTTSFASIQTRAKYLVSPFSFSRIILYGDLGAIAVHNLPVFPMSLRFFSGGMNSIRGYRESSIGPGKYLAVGSVEYQNRIKGELFGAVFYDIGNSRNHFPGKLKRGTGVGLVFNTRLGPVKAYVTHAIDKKSNRNGFEFSVGPEFA